MREKSIPRPIGNRIRARRVKAQLRQSQLARRCGLDPSYLSRIERGRVNPTVGTLLLVADALGVRPSELLDSRRPASSKLPCPVTSTGQCLLDLVDRGRIRSGTNREELYTLQQLRLARSLMLFLQDSKPELLDVLESFLARLRQGDRSGRT